MDRRSERVSGSGDAGWRRWADAEMGTDDASIVAKRMNLGLQASITNTPDDELRNVGRSSRTDNAMGAECSSRQPLLRFASGEQLRAEPLCLRDALHLDGYRVDRLLELLEARIAV